MCSTHRFVWFLLCFTLLAQYGCRGYQAAQQQRAAQQSALQQIIVTPGDLSGQPYRILGSVDYPGPGMAVISFPGPPTCTPDKARQAAVERYGRVDAIIGFNHWQDGSTPHCGGTAVVFTGQ